MSKIIMIPPMWGGPWCWDKFCQYFDNSFGDEHEYIKPELLYHFKGNENNPELGRTSIFDYMEDLEKRYFIDKDVSDVIVIGFSMGGLLAEKLASKYPIKGVCALTPSPHTGIFALKTSTLKSFAGVMSRWGFWKKPMKISFKAAVYSMLHLVLEEEQKHIYDKFVFESGKAATEIGFSLMDFSGAAVVDVEKITCPMLIVGADQDRITPVEVTREIASTFPQAQYQEFHDHAHWVIGEQNWEEIADCVVNWIRKL